MGVLDTDDPLYDAFRRYDQYGILGWEIQPWAERARLFLMAISLVPLKFLGCVYFVGCFYLICRCVLTACFRPAVMYLTAFCKRGSIMHCEDSAHRAPGKSAYCARAKRTLSLPSNSAKQRSQICKTSSVTAENNSVHLTKRRMDLYRLLRCCCCGLSSMYALPAGCQSSSPRRSERTGFRSRAASVRGPHACASASPRSTGSWCGQTAKGTRSTQDWMMRTAPP